MTTGVTNQRDLKESPVSTKRGILLVDEINEDLRFYRILLEERGFEVEVCDSFEDGARRLKSRSFDFIMVGQGSRAFEGRKVVEKALSADRSTPLLVITRCIDMNCYLEAMQLGAVDYMEKPITAAQIVQLAEKYSHRSDFRACRSTH